MYEATCSSPLPTRPPFESDEISLFLHHLLNSSSSSSPSTTSTSSPSVKPPNHRSHPSSSSPLQPSLFASGPQYDHNHTRPSHLLAPALDSDTRLTSASTDHSSGFLLKETAILSTDSEALAASAKRRKLPLENDFDDFDCESEEGLEGSEGPTKSAPSRSSSKRSRAAEVHNLSEKRRRSRINEKMKALQNLIPNSNKTDKASMLDEAIEYLKQLQLQVQMLSMRNGFSLHPMYLPGVVQLPQVRMGFNEGNGLPPHMSIGRETLTVNPETSTQNSFGLSNQCTTSNQPMVMPSMANITPSETSYGLDTSLQGHQGSFQLPATSEEIYTEQMLRQQQFYLGQPSRPSSGDNQMKALATTSLPFDAHTSAVDHPNCVEASVLQRETTQGMLANGVDNGQTFIHHLQSLPPGVGLPNDNPR